MRRFATSTLAILMGMMIATGAYAQSDIGFKGAGGKLSFVFPDAEGIDNAFGAGVFTDLGTIIPELRLQATLDFWSKSEDVPGGEVSFRDIAIGARTSYTFALENNDIKPYVAGGLAIHLLKSEVDIPAIVVSGVVISPAGTAEDTDTRIGLDLAGGALFAVGENVDILGEGMFRIVSDVSQFVISAGVVYWFER